MGYYFIGHVIVDELQSLEPFHLANIQRIEIDMSSSLRTSFLQVLYKEEWSSIYYFRLDETVGIHLSCSMVSFSLIHTKANSVGGPLQSAPVLFCIYCMHVDWVCIQGEYNYCLYKHQELYPLIRNCYLMCIMEASKKFIV